jgi:hypothetical protein
MDVVSSSGHVLMNYEKVRIASHGQLSSANLGVFGRPGCIEKQTGGAWN